MSHWEPDRAFEDGLIIGCGVVLTVIGTAIMVLFALGCGYLIWNWTAGFEMSLRVSGIIAFSILAAYRVVCFFLIEARRLKDLRDEFKADRMESLI